MGRRRSALGGAEDEDDVLGGLLQGLEEGVGSLAGEHVGFVDDIDLAAVLGGLEVDLFADLADFLHAAIAGGVQLDDVQVAALVDGDADSALVAGVALLWIEAVDGLGEDAGCGGLAAAPGAAEEVAVADAALRHSLAEGVGDMLLPGQVAEGAGPPLAIINLRRGGHQLPNWGVSVISRSVPSVTYIRKLLLSKSSLPHPASYTAPGHRLTDSSVW